jgi:hypothetical protein
LSGRLMFFLAAAALLALAGWLTPIAFGSTGSSLRGVSVEAAGPDAAPQAVFFGNAYGAVTPGDLYYIDASGYTGDLEASIILTNAAPLTHYLRYLILTLRVHPGAEGDGRLASSGLRDACILTLQNSTARFILPGGGRYKIMIDSGAYYCFPAEKGGGKEPPQFYLSIKPG